MVDNNSNDDIECIFEDYVSCNAKKTKFYATCIVQRSEPVYLSIDDVVKVKLEVCMYIYIGILSYCFGVLIYDNVGIVLIMLEFGNLYLQMAILSI